MGLFDDISDAAKDSADAVAQTATGAAGAVGSAAEDVGHTVSQAAYTGMDSFGKSFQISQALRAAISEAKSAYHSASTAAENAIASIGRDILEGKAKDDIAKYVPIANDLISAWPAVVEEYGPSIYRMRGLAAGKTNSAENADTLGNIGDKSPIAAHLQQAGAFGMTSYAVMFGVSEAAGVGESVNIGFASGIPSYGWSLEVDGFGFEGVGLGLSGGASSSVSVVLRTSMPHAGPGLAITLKAVVGAGAGVVVFFDFKGNFTGFVIPMEAGGEFSVAAEFRQTFLFGDPYNRPAPPQPPETQAHKTAAKVIRGADDLLDKL